MKWLDQILGIGENVEQDAPTTYRDGKFPDTPPHELPARMRALARRRAKNKVGRASRKRNR